MPRTRAQVNLAGPWPMFHKEKLHFNKDHPAVLGCYQVMKQFLVVGAKKIKLSNRHKPVRETLHKTIPGEGLFILILRLGLSPLIHGLPWPARGDVISTTEFFWALPRNFLFQTLVLLHFPRACQFRSPHQTPLNREAGPSKTGTMLTQGKERTCCIYRRPKQTMTPSITLLHHFVNFDTISGSFWAVWGPY